MSKIIDFQNRARKKQFDRINERVRYCQSKRRRNEWEIVVETPECIRPSKNQKFVTIYNGQRGFRFVCVKDRGHVVSDIYVGVFEIEAAVQAWKALDLDLDIV